MQQCLAAISSEDLDFRAMVNQQLYRVHKRLARGGVRSGRPDERDGALPGHEPDGGHAGRRDRDAASRCARPTSARATAPRRRAQLQQRRSAPTGSYEYPVAVAAGGRPAPLRGPTSGRPGPRGAMLVGAAAVSAASSTRAVGAVRSRGCRSTSARSRPLRKDLTVRAGELALGAAAAAAAAAPGACARPFEEEAGGRRCRQAAPEEQIARLWEYPGDARAQEVLDGCSLRPAARRRGAARGRPSAPAERGARCASARCGRWRTRRASAGWAPRGAARRACWRPLRRSRHAPLALPLENRDDEPGGGARHGLARPRAARAGRRAARPALPRRPGARRSSTTSSCSTAWT